MLKEKQIRSPMHNLLMCVIKQTEEDGMVFEVKRNKQIEYIPLETVIDNINKFAEETEQNWYIAQR